MPISENLGLRTHSTAMNEQLKSCKHRAIEDKIQLLSEVISTSSSPAVFGGHVVQSGFMAIRSMDEVLQVKGDGPLRMVQRLLTAVVTTIKNASTPEGSVEYFDRFVAIVGEELQLPDIAQQVLGRRGEFCDTILNVQVFYVSLIYTLQLNWKGWLLLIDPKTLLIWKRSTYKVYICNSMLCSFVPSTP